MTVEELHHFIRDRFDSTDRRIDEVRSDLKVSNSRIDVLNNWLMTSLVGTVVALVGAILAWLSPKH